MPESFRTRLTRWGFNFFPAYRGTGGRIAYIADDFHEIHVRIPLSRRTRNYVGTIFGGSMYGAVDPIYMVMLIKILGSDYVVWDQAAKIEFKRPGRDTLHARFVLTEAEIAEIKSALEHERSLTRVYHVELVNDEGKVHAKIEKTLYLARKDRAAGKPRRDH